MHDEQCTEKKIPFVMTQYISHSKQAWREWPTWNVLWMTGLQVRFDFSASHGWPSSSLIMLIMYVVYSKFGRRPLPNGRPCTCNYTTKSTTGSCDHHWPLTDQRSSGPCWWWTGPLQPTDHLRERNRYTQKFIGVISTHHSTKVINCSGIPKYAKDRALGGA